jgi:hypothetical protein
MKVCKLVDGSFIVGKQNKEGDIIEAVELISIPDRTGGMGMAIVPLMYPFNTDITNNLTINSRDIIVCMEANDELVSKYVEATIGIITPKSIITN